MRIHRERRPRRLAAAHCCATGILAHLTGPVARTGETFARRTRRGVKTAGYQARRTNWRLMADADLLAIVEAAYRVDVTDDEWLRGIAAACRPALDEGFGLCVFEFQHQMGCPPQILRASLLGIPDELAKMYGSVFKGMAPDVQVRPFTHGPCTTGSQMMGQRGEFVHNEYMQRHVHRFGMYDSVWITAAEPSGSGCGIHSGRPHVGWASRPFRERWARVASHLAAATRIRGRLRDAGALPPVEAIVATDGTLLHAEGPAQEPEARARLRRAVLDVEQARGSHARSDALSSLRGWQGLVDGRWSLLDEFESSGKRYVVARENAPRPPGPGAFTERERQVVGYAALGHDNKIIAYDLGIAHATVKVLMARAAAKLGVGSRGEVITAYLEACGKPGQHTAASPFQG
jgi:DNA-binding CsgD family transcriptional regulator